MRNYADVPLDCFGAMRLAMTRENLRPFLMLSLSKHQDVALPR